MPLGATPHHPSRVHRAKALAAGAVAEAEIPTTTLATSLVYAPGDRRLARLERLALLPAVPLTGRGAARTQPVWAEDAADGVLAALERGPARATRATSWRARRCSPTARSSSSSCAPPAAAAARCPSRSTALRAGLKAGELLAGPTTFATWDEALMLAVPMLSAGGPAGLEALGVRPRRMAEVLGA